MGTDYSTNSAIVLTSDELIGIINSKNTKSIIAALQEFYNSQVEENPDDEPNEAIKALNGIKPNISIDQLGETINRLSGVQGEAGRYEGNCSLAHIRDYELQQLWDEIITRSGSDLPPLQEIRVFDSYRKHEECPIGVASFLFDEEDCYEKQLNDSGKTLEELSSGCLNEITWTDVSY